MRYFTVGSGKEYHLKPLKEIEKIAQKEPTNIEVNLMCAVEYAKLKNETKAEYYFNKCLQINSSDALVLDNLGTYCWNNGKHVKACEYFQKAYEEA
ncbi:MAG: hypothetical protein GY757_03120, partial [bacterium]|nr:hypothetical protein [bacterium]